MQFIAKIQHLKVASEIFPKNYKDKVNAVQ
jgi:hypothetical protein